MSSAYIPPALHSNTEEREQQHSISFNGSIVQKNTLEEENDQLLQNPIQRRDTEIHADLTTSLKKLKIFPIFGDRDMAKFSINYFLYFEFFHTAIRIFGEIFLFSLATYAIYLITYTFCSSDVAFQVKVTLNFLNGVVAVFLLKRARGKEESRILNEDMLYDLQWSEDLFSVLVQGLPSDITQEEINLYFKSIFDKDQPVVDMMLLHDYRKYVPLKKELAIALAKQSKLQIKGGKPEQVEKVNRQVKILQENVTKYTQKISQMKYFRGKAIVSFDTIETQAQVVRFFNYNWFKSILIFCFRSTFKQHYLRGHRISIQQVVEPRDLLFENLHCSSIEIFIRWFIVNGISVIVLLLALFLVFSSSDIEDAFKNMVENKLLSYLFAFSTTLLAIILQSIYLATQNILIHKSTIDTKQGVLDYSLYISFLLYCATQGGVGVIDMDFVVIQLLRLSIFFAAKTILFKLIEIYFTTKAVKHTSKHTSNSFLNDVVAKIQDQYHEFDFVKGITLIYPPLLIGSMFFCVDPQFLLPPLMIILYVYAILDKYRLIKGSKLYVSKSATFMLRPFSIYRYIPFLSFLFTMSLLSRVDISQLKESNYTIVAFAYMICSVGLVGSLYCPKPLDERVKEKFVGRNASVTYESVCNEFSSFFRKEDPYHQTKLTNFA